MKNINILLILIVAASALLATKLIEAKISTPEVAVVCTTPHLEFQNGKTVLPDDQLCDAVPIRKENQ